MMTVSKLCINQESKSKAFMSLWWHRGSVRAKTWNMTKSLLSNQAKGRAICKGLVVKSIKIGSTKEWRRVRNRFEIFSNWTRNCCERYIFTFLTLNLKIKKKKKKNFWSSAFKILGSKLKTDLLYDSTHSKRTLGRGYRTERAGINKWDIFSGSLEDRNHDYLVHPSLLNVSWWMLR